MKVNKQQAKRIADKQALKQEGSCSGVVVARYAKTAVVLSDSAEAVTCELRRHVQPVVGDHVQYTAIENGKGVIESLFPRRNQFIQLARGKEKSIAANIDRLLIVLADPPGILPVLVDQYLIASALMSIPPCLVVNKIDGYDDTKHASLKTFFDYYESIGIPVKWVSAKTEEGVQALLQYLKDDIGMLVGASGVGKSSLVNAMHPAPVCKIGELSPSDTGKHTTTVASLFTLPEGGRLIDTPGRYELSLAPKDIASLNDAFIEFGPHREKCQFRNCTHSHEPHCGVKTAVRENQIMPSRLESYYEMLAPLNPGS